jgi:hypothetical protein
MASEGKIAILLNGPPRAGKDTAITALMAAFAVGSAEILKVTQPIKDLTHKRLGLECSHDAYEIEKDLKLREFQGKTPRESYIATSAGLKREGGPGAVMDLFVDAVLASPCEVILNPDIGDDMEAERVAAMIGAERVLVIRIHRPGHDFSMDCRTWVNSPNLTIIDVHNEPGQRRVYESEVVAQSMAFITRVRSRDLQSFVA